MYCTYHTKNGAVVQCSGCNRPLCPACDHRIKGFPYCQDCIVTGVEMLKSNTRTSASPIVRRSSSPVIASLLSLICPGLGAAYNGQTSKAIVHFAIFASFFQMAVMTDGVPFFVFGFFGTWLFAAVDSFRTAQLIKSGFAPDAAEDVIAKRLYGNPLAWSITLVVLGTLFLLHTVVGIILPVKQMLPVFLVVLGGYLLFDYFKTRLKRGQTSRNFDSNNPPPSVISGSIDSTRFSTGDFATQISNREGSSIPYNQRN